MRYVKKSWRNLAVTLFVLPIKVPVLFALYLLHLLGEAADEAFGWVVGNTPGLEEDKEREMAQRRIERDEWIARITQKDKA
jgi:hypothetical protein